MCFVLCISCDLPQAVAGLPACWVCDISLAIPVLSVSHGLQLDPSKMKAVFLARRKFVHKKTQALNEERA